MAYSYFPGCTLKATAKTLELSALRAAEALDIELVEQKEWQCCGAVFPLSTDEIGSFLSSIRSLYSANQGGDSLVTLCAACHNVLKRANHLMATNAQIREKVHNYLNLENPYYGEGKVIHYLELLRDDFSFEKLTQKVVKPLTGRKVASYYGCLLLRPGIIMGFDDVENPRIMEDFVQALGGTPIEYPYRTECCGGYLAINNEEIVYGMVSKIIESALKHGAQELITACPLCHYNLIKMQKKTKDGKLTLPVYYFTELLEEALNITVAEKEYEISEVGA